MERLAESRAAKCMHESTERTMRVRFCIAGNLAPGWWKCSFLPTKLWHFRFRTSIISGPINRHFKVNR
jgi:hypothetical protein